MEDCWDLQAIVRGGCGDYNFSNSQPYFDGQQDDGQFPIWDFPDHLGASTTTSIFDELEQVYKPFYPPTSLPPLSSELQGENTSNNMASSSSSSVCESARSSSTTTASKSTIAPARPPPPTSSRKR